MSFQQQSSNSQVLDLRNAPTVYINNRHCLFRLTKEEIIESLEDPLENHILINRESILGRDPLVSFRCLMFCTANIFVVFFTVFSCVRISTVISQYGLHSIAAQNTVD